MLVLNRRAGEAIVIEGGVSVSVVSAREKQVWLRLEGERVDPGVTFAVDAAPTGIMLEIQAARAFTVDEDVHVTLADAGRRTATVSVHCDEGEGVCIGDSLRISAGRMERGNLSVVLMGESVGPPIDLVLIRPTRSGVRIGVVAPGRSVLRQEIFDALSAANHASAASDSLDTLRQRDAVAASA